MRILSRRTALFGGLSALTTATLSCRSKSDGSGTSAQAQEDSIGPLLAPAALAARLDDVRAGKIAVFYVGPEMLFSKGRVPGAKQLPALDSDEGPRALREALARVPPETEIVVYCGCCPVRNCPNVRPASAAIRALKRANAHVLDLPTRFSTDWSDKGFAVERT